MIGELAKQIIEFQSQISLLKTNIELKTKEKSEFEGKISEIKLKMIEKNIDKYFMQKFVLNMRENYDKLISKCQELVEKMLTKVKTKNNTEF